MASTVTISDQNRQKINYGVYVDDREKRKLQEVYDDSLSAIMAYLEFKDVPIRFVRLNYGDFMLVGRHGAIPLEYKAVIGKKYHDPMKEEHDMILSIFDGRANNQALELSRNFIDSGWIIEGLTRQHCINHHIADDVVQSAIMGIAFKRAGDGMQGAVRVFEVPNAQDTAKHLYYLYKKLNDENGLLRVYKAPATKKSYIDELPKIILMQFLGIREVKAEKIWEKYGCLREVFADPELMTTIRGIDKTIYNNFEAVLDLQYHDVPHVSQRRQQARQKNRTR